MGITIECIRSINNMLRDALGIDFEGVIADLKYFDQINVVRGEIDTSIQNEIPVLEDTDIHCPSSVVVVIDLVVVIFNILRKVGRTADGSICPVG
jgi:hypothetical protein